MRKARLTYKGIYLGTLWEEGKFDYELKSLYADDMNIEEMAHTLEVIRAVGKRDDFNFDNYTAAWNAFNDNFHFEEAQKFMI